MDLIESHIEVIIFTAQSPVSSAFISEMISQIHNVKLTEENIRAQVNQINLRYREARSVFAIREIADGFQVLTNSEWDTIISHVQSNLTRKRLSTASLEALSIVVYKQPVTKSVIESIRGVNSDYAIQKLLEKDLVKIIGRSEEPGRPLLYAAGDKFMAHFGISKMTDLPKLKEFREPEETIGRPDGEEE